MAQENTDEIQKKAEKFEVQYNKLKQEFKDYIETSKKNEEKKRLEIRYDISKRLLVVADSLTRISELENADSCELVKDHTENIRKNIGAVYSQMLAASGLTPIEPQTGDKFDEHKHIAIGLEYGAKYPDNTVFKVVRKGYLQENIVVRPAEVIISKDSIPQTVMKAGLWDRLIRYIMPEKVRLSEIKQDIDELDRIQKERIENITKNIESLKNSIHEMDMKIKQTNDMERLQEDKMNNILLEIQSLRNALDEHDYLPELIKS